MAISPVFTNSTEPAADADITHRRHAIIETVFADLIDGPVAHMPSGRFGANVVREPSVGRPAHADDDSIDIRLGATMFRVFAAIDATGRAARWSRPVARARPATATLHTGPPLSAHPRPGVIIRVDGGWAYRLDHPRATTLGVVSEPAAQRRTLDERLATELGIDVAADCTEVGVRSAAVQWSIHPVRERQLAIGDAALALNPLAGQGVRFALPSALSAAAVLATWAEASAASKTVASTYYDSFVGGVRARHLAQLQQIHAQSESPRLRSSSVNPNCRLTFSAPSRIVGQNRARRIIADEGFVLPDGGLVRSVGGIDLGLLRDATANQPTPDQLHAALKRRGLADRATQQLVGWALRHGVLEEATGVPAT